jgi:hypothetical protein
MIKTRGVSLATHLRRIALDCDASGVRFAGPNGNQSVTKGWSISHLDCAEGYVPAVASTHPIASLTSRNVNLPPVRSNAAPELRGSPDCDAVVWT